MICHCFRNPKTNNERKQTLTLEVENRLEDYGIKTRARYLPSNWDDILRSRRFCKSWKENRQHQFRV